MGSPARALRLLAVIGLLLESCRKLAVSVDALPASMEAGLAVWVILIQGVNPTAPVTRSHGATPGPWLQPHQLSVAVTVPATLLRPFQEAAVLPANRLKQIFRLLPALLLST